MPRTSVLTALLALALAGCRFGQIPNPNKLAVSSKYDGQALQQHVRQADEVLTDRLVKGQIDLRTKNEILHGFIQDQLKGVELEKVDDGDVWRFADVFRQLGDWQTTHDLYVRAVKAAKDEDRRVNDTLRLAEAKAHLGEVADGISLVRSTFDAAPGGKAPILMATLYEFVPAAMGQEHDLDVAKLLEDATEQQLLTVVDPKTPEGRAFLQARTYHIRRAWDAVVRIYRSYGEDEAMRAAIDRSDKMLRRFAIT